jgi:hypothetical protein
MWPKLFDCSCTIHVRVAQQQAPSLGAYQLRKRRNCSVCACVSAMHAQQAVPYTDSYTACMAFTALLSLLRIETHANVPVSLRQNCSQDCNLKYCCYNQCYYY